MSNGHSNIGPSSAERWMACPGSVALSLLCPPSRPTVHAAEGTVAHGLAEALVTKKATEIELWKRLGEIVKCDGYDIEITEDMVEGAMLYRDTIEEDRAALIAEDRPASVIGMAEEKVHIKSIAEDLWGTADYILFRRGHKLKVYDYKYGKGHAVEVEENAQEGLYLLGAMETIAGEAFDEAELIIIQPRARHRDGAVRRWTVPKAWIEGFRRQARAAVLETQSPNARLVAGDHCYWCPAKVKCPEIYKAAQAQAQADFSAIAPSETERKAGFSPLPKVELMPTEALAKALDWADTIEDWFGAVRRHAKELLSSGGTVPGYKLVNGRSNRKWPDEGSAAAARFEGEFGEQVYTTKKVLSPAQMEALVGKGKIDDLVVRSEPGKTVVKDADPRSVATTSAQDDFDPFKMPLTPAAVVGVDLAKGPDWSSDPFLMPIVVPPADIMGRSMKDITTALEAELLGVPQKKEPMWP